jgi:hypothetical protein
MIFFYSSDLDKELDKMKDLLGNIVRRMNENAAENQSFEAAESNEVKSSDRSSVII